MKIYAHNGCFICGNKDFGVDFELKGGWVESEVFISPKYQGFDGVTHGGIIASLLAEAMGTAVSLKFKKFLGKYINARFLKPVRTNETYTLRGRIKVCHGREAVCESEIMKDGEILSRGEGVFVIFEEKCD